MAMHVLKFLVIFVAAICYTLLVGAVTETDVCDSGDKECAGGGSGVATNSIHGVHMHGEGHAVYACDNSTLVTRTDWGARASKTITKMGSPVTLVFIHHTVRQECFTMTTCQDEVRGIQNFHMFHKDYLWDDIGYSFAVGQDGRVYEGRGWDRVGAHTLGWNNISVNFAVMGDFTDHVPNEAAIVAIHAAIQCGIATGKLTEDYLLYGHRDASTKFESPGEAFYNVIQKWPHYGPLPPVKPAAYTQFIALP